MIGKKIVLYSQDTCEKSCLQMRKIRGKKRRRKSNREKLQESVREIYVIGEKALNFLITGYQRYI